MRRPGFEPGLSALFAEAKSQRIFDLSAWKAEVIYGELVFDHRGLSKYYLLMPSLL